MPPILHDTENKRIYLFQKINCLILTVYSELVSDLYIVAEVVVLCLGHSVAINPGYGSISLEHGSSGVATTETKS